MTGRGSKFNDRVRKGREGAAFLDAEKDQQEKLMVVGKWLEDVFDGIQRT